MNKLPNELKIQLKDCEKSFEQLSNTQKIRQIDYCINHCWIEGDQHNCCYYATQINKLLNLKKEIEKNLKKY